MMLWAGLRILTAQAMITAVGRVLWWILGGVYCRECGFAVHPPLLWSFVETGCPSCDGKKLRGGRR